MLYAWTIVAIGFLGGVDAAKSDPLAGTWEVVSTTVGGSDDPQHKDQSARFADGKVTFKGEDGKDHSAKYTLHTDKKPAAIDLEPTDGDQNSKPVKGIFAVENDELKLCLATEGGERPKEFRSKQGDNTALIVLKKKKK